MSNAGSELPENSLPFQRPADRKECPIRSIANFLKPCPLGVCSVFPCTINTSCQEPMLPPPPANLVKQGQGSQLAIIRKIKWCYLFQAIVKIRQNALWKRRSVSWHLGLQLLSLFLLCKLCLYCCPSPYSPCLLLITSSQFEPFPLFFHIRETLGIQ